MELDPGPDETPLQALLRAQQDFETHYWVEDDLHPYTPYDLERDRVKYLRLWYRDHLAPPV